MSLAEKIASDLIIAMKAKDKVSLEAIRAAKTAFVIGIGKMVGVAVAILADIALGAVLDTANNSGYFWAFVIAGLSYLIILIFVHLLMPRMTPMDDNLKYILNDKKVIEIN
jgi:hypothetical protein